MTEIHYRYFLAFGGQEAREVTKQEWVAAERSAGFVNTMGRPDEPGTGGFGNGYIRGSMEMVIANVTSGVSE